MTDLALRWDNALFQADLALDFGKLATDDSLRTAVIISLFSDARAESDDPLPDAGGDRRGWWGDAFAGGGRGIGSRLWLLDREKITREVVGRARDYAREALQWLVDDGVASAVSVDAEAQPPAVLAIGVTIDRPGGPARQRFDFVWEATA